MKLVSGCFFISFHLSLSLNVVNFALPEDALCPRSFRVRLNISTHNIIRNFLLSLSPTLMKSALRVDNVAEAHPRAVDGTFWACIDGNIIEESTKETTAERGDDGHPEVVVSRRPY